VKVLTIGFTKKAPKQFFEMLRASGAKRIGDVRLNNRSQFASFAKKGDLAYDGVLPGRPLTVEELEAAERECRG
jgi:hypothetical protein